ncbi:MAG: aldehyde ferredoxin oxidoreductase family protein [Deltaproteobacteria bacterium]|nr:aldehyde ferredoxin oxidoreductase family protein [Deltaproteobacteria bacterium]
MFGWTGTILEIDIDRRQWTTRRPGEAYYHRHLGGKGIAGEILRSHIENSWDHPDMPLVFATGPLVATPAPTSGRMVVASRSPLTGTVGDASVGGRLGFQIKRAGYDAIVITGQSRQWTGITIVDDAVSFQDAGELCRLPISQRLRRVKSKGACALIGPAAESGVLFASIMVDGHFTAGRGGLGLVMAKKKMSYLRVTGSRRARIYDTSELSRAREEIFRLAAAAPVLMGDLGITRYGTAALFDLIHSRRMMPTDNFRRTHFPGAERMNAFQYRKTFGSKKTGCAGCHILCKKKDSRGRPLPEYETMSHFHALVGNDNMAVTVNANRLCNDLGMDTISAAATLACHAELTAESLSPESIVPFLEDIGYARGIGQQLKMGSYHYAAEAGKPEASMTVKRLELPAYDPRGAFGMALGYALSTRGGCHLRAYPISHEILRKPVATDRFSFSGKARIIKIAEDLNAAVDSLTACKFIFFGATLEEYARALYGVTGMQTTGQDLLKIGERIYYNERIMNALNGFSASDDDLPKRFFEEPGSHGDGIRIDPLNRDNFIRARSNYYRIRGLSDNGLPTREKCRELKLKWK